MGEREIETKTVTDGETGRGRNQFVSSRQTLGELRNYAARQGNLVAQEAIDRLDTYIVNGDLDESYVPVKRMMQDAEEFRNGKINKNEFLVLMLLQLENFGAAVRDIGIVDKIAELAGELEAKEIELALEAITTEIDFAEIPAANQRSGDQDTFELFARDYLDALQFEIVQGPGRGADAGRDLIVVGKKPAGQGEQDLRWLVSCKHFAHSQNKRSVTPDDEPDISDRVLQAGCDAFMGF